LEPLGSGRGRDRAEVHAQPPARPDPAALRDHLVERRLDTDGETYVFGGAREARRMT
jgi:hypothetical protein